MPPRPPRPLPTLTPKAIRMRPISLAEWPTKPQPTTSDGGRLSKRRPHGWPAETLERTQQEDWPAVIDAFAESLAAAGRTAAPVAAGETVGKTDDAETIAAELPGPAEPDAHVVAKADLDAAAADAATGVPEATAAPEPPPAPEPSASPAAENPVAVAAEPPPAADPGPASSLPAMDAATSAGQSLAIENACFASRVQRLFRTRRPLGR